MVSKLTNEQEQTLLRILEDRFEKNSNRHPDLKWSNVLTKLESNPEKLWSLNAMEETGGEPDVIGYNEQKDEYIFYDCAKESPKGRRSLCYDQDALESRKKCKPEGNVLTRAAEMGIELLNEKEYRKLQEYGEFDTKTSSWILTPPDIRTLGGAIFGDFRYGKVFIYHNGAESYYAARGFRGSIRV